MIIYFILVFMGGCTFGFCLMALLAAGRDPEPHEVHVYCDEHGNLEIMTLPPGDKIIWHDKPEEVEGVRHG